MSEVMELRGVYTALVTPFDASGEGINSEALTDLVEYQITNGIHGLVAAGTLGESTALSAAERARTVEVVVGAAASRVPVVAGASAYTTATAVQYSKQAINAGADAVMVMPLGFWKPSVDELVRHFAAISEAIDGAPIIVYNNPRKAEGVDITPETLEHLEREAGVKYIKETSYDIHRNQEIIARLGDKVSILTGDDGGALPAFVLGAPGWISATSNYIPAICAEMFDAFEAGDLERAKQAHYTIIRVRSTFESYGRVTSVVKAATAAAGVAVGDPRPPMLPLAEDQRNFIATSLTGLLEGAAV